MNYHDIKHDDMLNGDGIRVTLFVSGCDHNCNGCHNPETHDVNSGIPYDDAAESEVMCELKKPYVSGITISGGDPLNKHNLRDVATLVYKVRKKFPAKNIWLYTGYVYDQIGLPEYFDLPDSIFSMFILQNIDVLVDGYFDKNKLDVNAPYVGSTNQRIIRLKNGRITSIS